MGFISQEDIERVREASDFVDIASGYVTLRRSGRNYKACCPFHDERTPSFQIDPDLKLWHCFGCGQGGDIFDFVARVNNVDFPDAVRLLADKAHIEITEVEGGKKQPRGQRERLKLVCDEAAAFYHHELMRSRSEGAAAARTYLGGRGFGMQVCKRWELGFAPGRNALVRHLRAKGFTDEEMTQANVAFPSEYSGGGMRDRFFNRVMFPIHDKLGRTIAFGGRVIGPGEPKYLNSSETSIFHKSSNLFGIDRAKASITSEACAVVVEGYTDTIALHEAGIENVVATLGTALTPQHVKTLRSMAPRRIIYLFDGDAAGQRAADRASGFIDWGITAEAGRDQVEFSVVVLPDNLDPADYVAERGADAMREQLSDAVPLIRFAIDRRLAAWDLRNPVQRDRAMRDAVALLAPIKTSLIAADYCNYIADALDADVALVSSALLRATSQRPSAQYGDVSQGSQQQAATPSPESASDRADRELLTLLARFPALLDEYQPMLDRIVWGSQQAQEVYAALAGADAIADGEHMVVAVQQQVPAAAQYFAGGTLDPKDDLQASQWARRLVRQARIRDLERRIRRETRQLRDLQESGSEEYDRVFRQVAAYQKELGELRVAAEREVTP